MVLRLWTVEKWLDTLLPCTNECVDEFDEQIFQNHDHNESGHTLGPISYQITPLFFRTELQRRAQIDIQGTLC